MNDPLPPEIEALFESRRKRTRFATILDSDLQVLAKGEFRPGTEGDDREVFYPQSPRVLDGEQLARASLIQTEDVEVQIQRARHCWCGSEIHLHFDRVS